MSISIQQRVSKSVFSRNWCMWRLMVLWCWKVGDISPLRRARGDLRPSYKLTPIRVQLMMWHVPMPGLWRPQLTSSAPSNAGPYMVKNPERQPGLGARVLGWAAVQKVLQPLTSWAWARNKCAGTPQRHHNPAETAGDHCPPQAARTTWAGGEQITTFLCPQKSAF